MNADHRDSLILLAREFAGIESQEAAMTAVDRLGFHVRMKTAEGIKGARMAFLGEVSTSAETRKMLVEMVQQAPSLVNTLYLPELIYLAEPLPPGQVFCQPGRRCAGIRSAGQNRGDAAQGRCSPVSSTRTRIPFSG